MHVFGQARAFLQTRNMQVFNVNGLLVEKDSLQRVMQSSIYNFNG